jgi:hydrogenase/urease accessory protein HupE
MTSIRSWVVVLFCVGVAKIAAAHPAPFSYFDFRLTATAVDGVLVVHDFDAAHELGLDRPERLLDPKIAQSNGHELTRILEQRVRIAIDGQVVPLKWTEVEVLPERQSLRLPFRIDSEARGRIEIDTVLFPYDENHQSFINIYDEGGLKHQAILSTEHHALSYYRSSVQGRWAVVRDFAQAGIHHIFIGIDHILFLIGLLLLGGSLWRLTTIVTAFTLGHSVTLSLAVLEIVRIAPHIVEPAIALSIVVVGVDNLLVRNRRSQSDRVRDLRPWLAAVFGLIHGFGFAAVLLEVGLPREALGWSLAAFNIGVELGQLAIVLVAAAALVVLRRHHPAAAERVVLIGSFVVIVAGGYWFVQRI